MIKLNTADFFLPEKLRSSTDQMGETDSSSI